MKALIMADIQNDFLPTGALPVPEGDQIIPVVNRLQSLFELVIAIQDWHPADHKSFAIHHHRRPGDTIDLNGIEQILWPVHCVQNTVGAELAVGLERSRIDRIVQKGQNPEVDSYSGFFDNDRRSATGLAEYLREKNVSQLYLTGLALDVCVKYTALDARRLGFETVLILNASRAVNLVPGDRDRAIATMKDAGVRLIAQWSDI
jgi:nicotinamidase/pyrazinamidase